MQGERNVSGKEETTYSRPCTYSDGGYANGGARLNVC